MIVFRKIFQSSIGRKTLMAVTGAALILFLFAHLSGNLLMFAGQDAMNNYAVSLREMGPLLWIARIGLLTIFVIHIGIGISLSIQNRRARPERYQYEKTIQASVASRFMIQTGLLLLFYLLYHLAHFTLGLAHEQYFHLVDTSGRHDVYSMVVLGFRQWYISLIYIVAMLLLAFHLSHGLPSLFQTLGWNSPRTDRVYKTVGTVVALILFFGFTSIPVAVMLKIIDMP